LEENLSVVSRATGSALEQLCTDNVANFSRMLADYFHCAAGGNATRLLDDWEGIEHLEQARAAGKGVILVTAHLGNWELGGILLALRGLPMSVVTLEEPTTELTRWRDAYRQKVGIRTHAVGPGHDFAFLELIRTLRDGGVVAMLVDRPYAGSGISVEFFGRRAEFSSGAALLWQHTGAPVVPAFVLRNSRGGYTAFAQPPLEFVKTRDPRADLAANTQVLATRFEHVIREYPDQWFNYVPIWPASPRPAPAESAGTRPALV
jgi:KDO2-lipid IV(A) lauroyltransferase